MNPNSKGARRQQKGLRLWTLNRALAALPYVAPVLRSLRDSAVLSAFRIDDACALRGLIFPGSSKRRGDFLVLLQGLS